MVSLRPERFVSFVSKIRCYGTSSKGTKSPKPPEKEQKSTDGFPEEPTACCQTGCPNCVWLDYADKLSEYFKDGGARADREIDERISDPNLRAYLKHELRMRRNTKK